MQIIPPKATNISDLCKYHDKEFIQYLLNAEKHILDSDSECQSDSDSESDLQQQEFGLQYDCPVFQGLKTYVLLVSGASLSCADNLIIQHKNAMLQKEKEEEEEEQEENTNTTMQQGCSKNNNYQKIVAINWTGGRHHAKRAKAAGFCYINDATLAILRLRSHFEKIVYIDLDLHHGDGVESAFASSPNVLTISVHRYEPGFYPGSGDPKFDGKGKGIGFNLNINGQQGLSDNDLEKIFYNTIEPKCKSFNADAVVLVVGCDGLSKDEHKEWKLSYKGLDNVTNAIIQWDLPTLLLGGGGYNHTETAKCWAYITAGIANMGHERSEWQHIPDHAYYDDYKKDGFQL